MYINQTCNLTRLQFRIIPLDAEWRVSACMYTQPDILPTSPAGLDRSKVKDT